MVKKRTSIERLTPYLRGAIFAFFVAGYTLEQIRDEVKKPDGTTPCLETVSGTIQRCKEEGGIKWDGDVTAQADVGRSRVTTSALDEMIRKFVFKHRGRAKVTVAYVKKELKATRKLADRTLQRRLNEAGLKWLRRRRKSIVPTAEKAARKTFARWVLRQTTASLKRWAFTDGTVFYLARTAAEQQSAVRAALGPYVWRRADGSDALYEDCLGPSSYKKSQGKCVRIWGLLIAGFLFIYYVLPEGECMNRVWYEWLILTQFPKWITKALGGVRRKPSWIIQDHEKALWTPEPLAMMKQLGLNLLTKYPKHSQDLNAIETAWREVRSRLNETEPTTNESRPAFVVRLRAAVAWVNTNRRALFLELCSDQKDRAQEVLKMGGGRTSF